MSPVVVPVKDYTRPPSVPRPRFQHREFSLVTIKLILLNQPSIDISPFNQVVAKSTVCDVDTKRISPIGKFVELVNEALLDGDVAYAHLYLTFYFQLPQNIVVELSRFGNGLNVTAYPDNFFATGLLSGSFTKVRQFLLWATREDQSQWLRGFANVMYGLLRQYHYFQTLTSHDLADRTFMLRG